MMAKMNENTDKGIEELLKIAHGDGDMQALCAKAKINSVRNLEIYLRKIGMLDGATWSHEQIANEYDISRPRSCQICSRTAKLLKEYIASQR